MASPVSLIPHILPLVEGLSVLDVGCGGGLYGFLLRDLWSQTAAYQKFPDRKGFKYLVGLDIKKELVKSKIITEVYDEFVVSSAHKLPFIDNSFNTILCVEVIEHLIKSQAIKLLDEMDRVASKQIIISTPRDPLNKRYLLHKGKFPGVNWPKPDQHKSQTSLSKLEERGYQVIYSPRHYRNWHPVKLLKFLKFKFISTSLIAVKKMDNGEAIATSKKG